MLVKSLFRALGCTVGKVLNMFGYNLKIVLSAGQTQWTVVSMPIIF